MPDQYGRLDRLTAKHRRAIRLLARGERPSDVAKKMKIAPQTLSGWQASPAFRDELVKATAQFDAVEREAAITAVARAGAMLENASVMAAQRLVELMDDADDRVALQACREVLDRAHVGVKPEDGAGLCAPMVINAETALLIQQVMEESRSVPKQEPPRALPELSWQGTGDE
jgi:hypothetical protein